jgi:hypothetical protein
LHGTAIKIKKKNTKIRRDIRVFTGELVRDVSDIPLNEKKNNNK